MTVLDPGRYKRLVTVQRRGAIDETTGEPVADWGTVCQLWADIQGLTGAELWRAQSTIGTVQYMVRTRHPGPAVGDLDASMRLYVEHSKKLLQIVTVINEHEAGETLLMYCREFN